MFWISVVIVLILVGIMVTRYGISVYRAGTSVPISPTNVTLAPAGSWKLTMTQREELKTAINSSASKVSFLILPVPDAPSDAVSFGYDLMHLFTGMDGARVGEPWVVAIALLDAYNSPDEVGLKIATACGNDPAKNQNAQTLKNIFKQAKIETSFIGDKRLQGDAVKLVIGKHP